MSRMKVLLTVVTYPLPSRSYDELVCTAGILETGEWIRIYPVPLSFLMGQKVDGKMKSYKYTWIELELNKRENDFRPESYSPKKYDFEDLQILERIDTKKNWFLRKELCINNVYTNIKSLIEESKAPANKSLAVFKPSSIEGLEIESVEREWKDEWIELRKQGDLFTQGKSPEIMIKKLPYKFYYKVTDSAGNKSRMMIEDWEIGQLYWKCLQSTNGDEDKALAKVRQRYEEEFIRSKDIYLFLGTTMEWHRRRVSNPFVIIGVFYPKKELQLNLF